MKGELARAHEILTSTVCQCGREKPIHLAVCTGCWRRLPVEPRNALYARVGEGFGAAYERACGLLRRNRQLELS